jgi:hypothetical protein
MFHIFALTVAYLSLDCPSIFPHRPLIRPLKPSVRLVCRHLCHKDISVTFTEIPEAVVTQTTYDLYIQDTQCKQMIVARINARIILCAMKKLT